MLCCHGKGETRHKAAAVVTRWLWLHRSSRITEILYSISVWSNLLVVSRDMIGISPITRENRCDGTSVPVRVDTACFCDRQTRVLYVTDVAP